MNGSLSTSAARCQLPASRCDLTLQRWECCTPRDDSLLRVHQQEAGPVRQIGSDWLLFLLLSGSGTRAGRAGRAATRGHFQKPAAVIFE